MTIRNCQTDLSKTITHNHLVRQFRKTCLHLRLERNCSSVLIRVFSFTSHIYNSKVQITRIPPNRTTGAIPPLQQTVGPNALLGKTKGQGRRSLRSLRSPTPCPSSVTMSHTQQKPTL
jgi:hypothetical protein